MLLNSKLVNTTPQIRAETKRLRHGETEIKIGKGSVQCSLEEITNRTCFHARIVLKHVI